jgi:hypothetical protein
LTLNPLSAFSRTAPSKRASARWQQLRFNFHRVRRTPVRGDASLILKSANSQ